MIALPGTYFYGDNSLLNDVPIPAKHHEWTKHHRGISVERRKFADRYAPFADEKNGKCEYQKLCHCNNNPLLKIEHLPDPNVFRPKTRGAKIKEEKKFAPFVFFRAGLLDGMNVCECVISPAVLLAVSGIHFFRNGTKARGGLKKQCGIKTQCSH